MQNDSGIDLQLSRVEDGRQGGSALHSQQNFPDFRPLLTIPPASFGIVLWMGSSDTCIRYIVIIMSTR